MINEDTEKQKRTIQQNKALHKYLGMLAEALNDAGYDMKRTLKEDVEIPWNPQMAKEHLWRPIQRIVLDKESTAEQDTDEVSEVYQILDRHMQQKFGVHVPFPSRFGE